MQKKQIHPWIKKLAVLTLAGFILIPTILAQAEPGGGTSSSITWSGATEITSATQTSGETYTSTTASQNAVLINTSDAVTLTSPTVTKSGGTSAGDDESFYGINSAVMCKGGGTTTITGATVTTNAAGANGVFSYGGNASTNATSGDGTTVNISDSTITTTGNGSGGIMTTGQGITKASNLTITTSGDSSAAIRSDRGGGTVTVDGGTYETSGTGSPAIYATATINVSNATLTSTNSQGVVNEGGNTVILTDCTVNAGNATLGSQDNFRNGIFLYQSMSGDATDGASVFTMEGGNLNNTQGHVFHVTNTSANITLEGVTIANTDSEGVLISVCDDAWSGLSNVATVNAADQTLEGNLLVGSDSTLTMNLSGTSQWTGTTSGAITSHRDSTALSSSLGTVNLVLSDTATIILSGDTTISSLSGTGYIDYNGFTLTVGSTAYTSGNIGNVVEKASGTTYQVSVASVTGGTVTVSATSAAEGDTITVTATPSDGYELSTITVTDASSNAVTLTNNTFTMPASNVTVTATFTQTTSSSVTPPTAVTGLTYNGTAQALVTAGEASSGVMQYALGESAESAPTSGWSSTVPTGTNAGTYYVFYQVTSDTTDAVSFDNADAAFEMDGLFTGDQSVSFAADFVGDEEIPSLTGEAFQEEDIFGADAWTEDQEPVFAQVDAFTEGDEFAGEALEEEILFDIPVALEEEEIFEVIEEEALTQEPLDSLVGTEASDTSTSGVCTVVISPKELTLTWSETTLTYTGEAIAPTAEITEGLLEGDTCELTVTGSATEPGTYTATASIDNTNYTLSNPTTSFVIVAATVTPTATATVTPTVTATPTATVTPTVTPTVAPPAPTKEPLPTPTEEPLPTAIVSPIDTPTPVPTKAPVIIERVGKPQAKNVDEGVRLSWDGVENAGTYNVYRKVVEGAKEDGSVQWSKKELIGTTTSLSFTDTQVEHLSRYKYYVKAASYQEGENSYQSEGVSVGKFTIFLAEPKKAEARVEDNSILLELDPQEGVESYQVRWKDKKPTTGGEKLTVEGQEVTLSDLAAGNWWINYRSLYEYEGRIYKSSYSQRIKVTIQ